MQVKRFRSVITSTALLAVTLTGLEVGAGLTGGGAVAMAVALDPPPAEGEPTPCDGTPPEAGTTDAPVAADEPVPPGTYRYVPPAGADADQGAPDPEPAAESVPAAPALCAATPAKPMVAPGQRPGAGLPVLSSGMQGRKIQVLQVRLQRAGVLHTPVTGVYGKQTWAAVKRFQAARGYVRSGVVDAATLRNLVRRTGKVSFSDIAAGENRPYGARLATSCLTGRVVCVDKTGRTVRWVVDGKVEIVLDARFGATGTPTREGVFSINSKNRDHVSRLYGSSMPFAMFFNGGQAVHYSSDFASRGYYGASHGCVNTRQYSRMEKLFGRAQVGDKVVVYASRPVKG